MKTIQAQTHRQASEIREHVVMDSLFVFFKKHDFTRFQFVYGCLSVHRHNLSSRFYNHCLSQLSVLTSKLLFYNNM